MTNSGNKGFDKHLICFLIDQTKRMGEHALTVREPPSLVVHAHKSLLVSAVKMIFVNFIHAKIMAFVFSILLMATKQHHATVRTILMDQIGGKSKIQWIFFLIFSSSVSTRE